MLTEEIKLRIRHETYYIVPWSKVPPEKRSNLRQPPASALDGCTVDAACIRTLRDVIRKINPSDRQGMTDQQVASRARHLFFGHAASAHLVEREALMIALTNQRVLDWIKKAITSGSDPYSYLRAARKAKLDNFDDNLPAAERYFEGYDANYNQHFIAGMTLLKSAREVSILGQKPFEMVFGRNGSTSIEFVQRWGMLGVFDRENGITSTQRVQRGVSIDQSKVGAK